MTLTETCPAESATVQVTPFDGGCLTYATPPGTEPGTVPSFQPEGGLSFTNRSDLVASIEADQDLTVCGAGAPPCAPLTES